MILGFPSLRLPQRSDADEGMKRRKILATSNKFYTFIPMNFGMRQPPLIDSDERIKERLQMVEELLHLEVASKLLKVR